MGFLLNPYITAAAGGGSLLNPGSYLSALDWDMDADQISGNDGDAVVDWTDLSAGAKHYGQNTSANQPVLKKNIVNGHAVVRFATNDKLVADPNPRTFGTASTLILVCTPTSTGSAYILGGSQGEGGPAFISGFSSKAFEYFYTSGGERATFSTTASGFHILTLTRTDDTGNYILYYDGVQVSSTAVNTGNDWNTQSVVEIGANGNASGDDYFNGDIAYIIHFNANHAGAAGLTDLHNALKSRFGIA